jgi:hypothetical protein
MNTPGASVPERAQHERGVSEILCKLTRRVTNRSHSWNHSQQIKIQEDRKATVS